MRGVQADLNGPMTTGNLGAAKSLSRAYWWFGVLARSALLLSERGFGGVQHTRPVRRPAVEHGFIIQLVA